jgi:phage FluMu protein Com
MKGFKCGLCDIAMEVSFVKKPDPSNEEEKGSEQYFRIKCPECKYFIKIIVSPDRKIIEKVKETVKSKIKTE